MESRPPPERLWMARFSIQATQGLIRDRGSRRKIMAFVLGAAVLMMAVGLTALSPWLEPHEHPGRFIFFWFVCGWQVLTALLLAIADLLLLRVEGKRSREALEEQVSGSQEEDD